MQGVGGLLFLHVCDCDGFFMVLMLFLGSRAMSGFAGLFRRFFFNMNI